MTQRRQPNRRHRAQNGAFAPLGDEVRGEQIDRFGGRIEHAGRARSTGAVRLPQRQICLMEDLGGR
jgi:hypothetical protein